VLQNRRSDSIGLYVRFVMGCTNTTSGSLEPLETPGQFFPPRASIWVDSAMAGSGEVAVELYIASCISKPTTLTLGTLHSD
jgi:hypothetical protein